jgi:predicted dehydrogenase
MGGNLGLANNGIHAADLFIFYTGATSMQAAGSSIDPILHPSKRGGELFDLSGTLLALSDHGSRFSLSYTQDPHAAELYLLQSPRHRFIVDHFERWAMESDAASGWRWRSVPFEGNLLVSVMTQGFAREILTRRACSLPTLEESAASHRFILGELAPHFDQLLERKSDLCPVP